MDSVFLSILTNLGQKTIPLTSAPITLGRSPENSVMIEDAQASRFHCVIEWTKDGFLLRDLDSRNGTKVNGRPVKQAALKRDDVMSIGTTELRLVMPEASGAFIEESGPEKPPQIGRAGAGAKAAVAKPAPLIPRRARGGGTGPRSASRPAAKAPPVPRREGGAPAQESAPGEELRFRDEDE